MDLSFLTLTEWLGKPVWMWVTFLGVVIALMAFDLGVLEKRRKRKLPADDDGVMGVGQSLWLSAFYIAIALIYGVWVWLTLGRESGMAFYTGFALEKALALDNVFVISLIFAFFAIPLKLQRRVLLWGILGVIVLRAIMIGLGTALVTQFDWVLWIFGAFLLFTGIKMLRGGDEEHDFSNNRLLVWLRKHLRITDTLHGERFTVKQMVNGKLKTFATPLLLALIMVETADVIFAVDSIPAIFAITQDPFIVYTSNIFAILGLRALYFALAAMVHRFEYLKPALSLVLVFIGLKIFYAQLWGKLDPAISLGVTMSLLAGGVIISLIKTRPAASEPPASL
ncbi:TerC family protein [Deinococcus humi]|uniref:Tellurite resistance protein TerC n=1 Tax=Deinococcus humi TaxID=662880 RepID=A0A7W8NGR5_9DEIO|nr:TerC family protein [Deinococcus humi]MBB5365040.1 tellurite resistance protein TerC [Deinococcus humi]GGO34721.1 transporter [Deinococcus humi]